MTQGGHDDWRRPLCRALESCRRVGARGGRERTEQLAGTTLTRKRRAGSCSRGSTRRPDCQPGQRRAGFDVVATCGYIVALKTVAVRELKNRLSAYLREVAAGEVVLVTDRGRVVAELRRPSAEALPSPAEQALERLVAAGVLTIGLPQDPSSYRRTAVRIARSSQTLLDAERADR